MPKHREPDPAPLKRGSRRRDGGTADALRAYENLPVYPAVPGVYEWAVAMIATELGLPGEVVRRHIDRLKEADAQLPSPLGHELVETALAILATDLYVPVERVRVYFSKLKET